MLRRRLLAVLLDLLVVAAAADAAGLLLTFILWRYVPAARPAVPWLWYALAAAGTAAFLLRDARGGRARRWLALEARRPDGRPPGPWGSVRRNLPLLLPFWNVWDAWPLTRDGEAARRCDRTTGVRISNSD
ncbi:MAG TPA: RDD family protein [Thermoanaerobaculia bacterium]|nr:RDD family protein [Thermoanaerobaculia bacterium]